MNKKQKQGALMVLIGLCMVFAATFLHVTQQRQDIQAGDNSQILLRQLELSRMSIPAEPGTQDTLDPGQIPAMPEKEYMGYIMIGVLRIPALGMELPILRDWSYELLNVAPCRYSGSAPGENMILMGHNYKSHFTSLHNITAGTEVTFEDANGVVYRYRVSQILTLHKSQGEQLPSDYPLTLFTCTSGGQNRIVVRCTAEEDPL